MGAVGGGLWHLIKGVKNSPGGARTLGGIEVPPCVAMCTFARSYLHKSSVRPAYCFQAASLLFGTRQSDEKRQGLAAASRCGAVCFQRSTALWLLFAERYNMLALSCCGDSYNQHGLTPEVSRDSLVVCRLCCLPLLQGIPSSRKYWVCRRILGMQYQQAPSLAAFCTFALACGQLPSLPLLEGYCWYSNP